MSVDKALAEYLDVLSPEQREQVETKLATNDIFKQQLPAAILNLATLVGAVLTGQESASKVFVEDFFTITENVDPLTVDMYKLYLENDWVPRNFKDTDLSEDERLSAYLSLQRKIYTALNIL